MKLEGKKIILTGASSGIGKAVLNELLKIDCQVVVGDLNSEDVESAGGKVFPFHCDVGVQKNIDDLFDFALKKMGCVDIFIANAGFAYYEEMKIADWGHIEKIFQVNTFSPFYSAVKLKEICGDKPFQFLTTASAMGIYSLPGYALYSSTKAAVSSFAESYRYQLKRNQSFQVVYPIATKTNFFEEAGGSPVPFPCQSIEIVAKCMIRGLKKKKNSIYPSKIFLIILLFCRFFPIIKLYRFIENRKLKKWISEK